MSKSPPGQKDEQIQTRARAAAVRLFSRRGFEGTSVQAIADEVGTSKQALLYHFSSKEGLRQAALDEMVSTWRAVLPRFLAALTRKEAPFEEALAEILQYFRAEPAYARFMMQELLSGARHPGVTDVDTWLGFAAEYIRQAQRDGLVGSGVDPEAWLINAGTFILASLSLLDGGERPDRLPSEERVLKELARIIGSSLRGSADDGPTKGNS